MRGVNRPGRSDGRLQHSFHLAAAMRSAMLAGACALLASCGPAAPPPRLTRVVVTPAEVSEYAQTVTLTGDVAARVTADLSFRVGGQILERRAEVGDRVDTGQILALLNPKQQQAGLDSAQAEVDAAEAQIRQASAAFDRQKALIGQGFTTRREYDQAEAALRTGQAALETAKSSLGNARDQLDQTTLRAPGPGVVTGRKAEGGEVVEAAQTVYTFAQDGPRDAVFSVYESIFAREPADATIKVALVDDPKVERPAKLREVSPVVDGTNGTIRVKFEISDPPPEMTLGAALSGSGRFKPARVTAMPWTAVASDAGNPAVWVVDPATKAASLRRIEIESYEANRVLIRKGIAPGELVVTRGQQLLRPGQAVDPVPASAS